MKKITILIFIFTLFTSILNASMLNIKVGVAAWMQAPKATATYNNGSGLIGHDTLKKKEQTLPYIWLSIKQPIFLIPNIRLEYSQIKANGSPYGQWGSTIKIGAGTTTSTLKLNQYDIIPYYNLLDNRFFTTIDLGIDFKVLQGSYSVAPVASFAGYTTNKTLAIPMLYGRLKISIPDTNLAIIGIGKYVADGHSTISDYSAKISYIFTSVPVIEPAIEVGYRSEHIKIDESSSDVKTNLTFSGIFTGLMFKF